MWRDLTMQQRSDLMQITGIFDPVRLRQEYDAYLIGTQDLDYQAEPNEYSKGGHQIHINPANKGKFNATKKRTGKTTEELTHSKNPLTRKRAIFAQNARRWAKKHDNGGYLDDIIWDNLGQWSHPGQITGITGTKDGTDITMNGVAEYLIGKDNLGNVKFMKPGMDYHFPGSSVVEYPVSHLSHKAQDGKKLIITPEQEQQAKMRYSGYFNAMVNNGINPAYARDAAYYATQQSFAEAGWKPNKHNNYGGMKNSKGLISYPSEEAYFDAWVKNANNKWPDYYKSQSIQDWDEALNHTSLGLFDKDQFYKYQKKNPGVYIYAPAWENDSYLNKMQGVKNRMDGALGVYPDDVFMEYTYNQDPLNKRIENNQIAQTYQYGGLIKPFSYTDIPVVRYDNGGNLFQSRGWMNFDPEQRLQQLYTEPVQDNTFVTQPLVTIGDKKAYEADQERQRQQQAEQEYWSRIPVLKSDTTTEEDRRKYRRQAEYDQNVARMNETAANFGRAIGANYDFTPQDAANWTLNTMQTLGYTAAPITTGAFATGYYGFTGRPKEATVSGLLTFAPAAGKVLNRQNLNALRFNTDPLNKAAGVRMNYSWQNFTNPSSEIRQPFVKFIRGIENKPIELGNNPYRTLIEAPKDYRTWDDAMWDFNYNNAINSGNLIQAQRLRDLHFASKTPNNAFVTESGLPQHNYHGTNGNPNFNEFDLKYFGTNNGDQGDRGIGFYFSEKPKVALDYGPIAKDVYLYGQNPYNGDRQMSYYLNRGVPNSHIMEDRFGLMIDDVSQRLMKEQMLTEKSPLYTRLGITEDMTLPQIRNTYKNTLTNDILGNINTADSYVSDYENVVYNPNQIKLSDVITRDNTGNIIPLSQRDNFSIGDIRYDNPMFDSGRSTDKMLSVETRDKLWNKAKNIVSDYYNSEEFKNRALAAGYNEKDYKELIRELGEWLDSSVYKGEIYGKPRGNTIINKDDGLKKFVAEIRMNPYLTEDEYLNSLIHEMAHGSSANYEGQSDIFYDKFKQFYPQIKRMIEYDKSIQPYVKPNFAQMDNMTQEQFINSWMLSNPGISREEALDYYSELKKALKYQKSIQENRSRAISALLGSGDSENLKQLEYTFGKETTRNYLEKVLSVSPLISIFAGEKQKDE